MSLLTLVLFLFVARKILGLGKTPTFLASIYLGLCPIYLRRTQFGWFDTDAYNVLFPLLILGTLLAIAGQGPAASQKHRRLGATATLIGASGLYCLFWRGWLLFLALLAASLLICLLPLALKRFRTSKPPAAGTPGRFWLTPLCFAGPVIFTAIFFGWAGLQSYWNEALKLTVDFYLPKISLWPDTFLTVGELGGSGFGLFGKLVGGTIFFALAAAGPVLEYRRADRRIGVFSCGFLLTLLFLTAALGSHIQRFSILAVAASAIAIALALDNILRWPAKLAERLSLVGPLADFSKKLCAIAIGGALIATIGLSAHRTVRAEHPIYNRTWDAVMTYLRQSSPQDSIVTSWWSPGHFISGMARRRVTFDGATQNTPQAYWVARLFLARSEQEALGILRMIDLSGNDAADYLTAQGLKLSETIRLLDEILPLRKEEAAPRLSRVLNPDQTAQLLKLTHGDGPPPPAYLLVYDDMIRQAMGLQFVGNWRFDIAETLKTRLEQRRSRLPGRGSNAYVSLMWAMSRRPPVQQEEAFLLNARDERMMRFTNGLEIDPALTTARIKSDRLGSGTLKSLYRFNGIGLEKSPVAGATLDASALILRQVLPNPDPLTKATLVWRSVLGDEQFLESLACRLFYLKGAGLEAFELVKAEEDLQTRNKLYLFKVHWNGSKTAAGKET
ncbi:MAG: STT3 domain-containing protein [Candidatus Omnitrophota bacterium]